MNEAFWSTNAEAQSIELTNQNHRFIIRGLPYNKQGYREKNSIAICAQNSKNMLFFFEQLRGCSKQSY